MGYIDVRIIIIVIIIINLCFLRSEIYINKGKTIRKINCIVLG